MTEIVVGGNGGTVAAYEYKAGALAVKSGWPASTCSGGRVPRGARDGGGRSRRRRQVEIVVTTTNTPTTGAQVFVFEPDGKLFQPAGTSFTAWPRYNTATGPGGDADFNGQGNHGYGCYGENVGIGNLDDDAQLEIVVTYDNHQINVFKMDGTSVLASSWYTNPATQYLGQRMGWGQFIRWADPTVEDDHYHAHTGAWPDVNTTMWLQWTASPPNVVDLDGDGKNDVVGIPNAEMHTPYVTQAFAFMVLDGRARRRIARGAAARRLRRTLPMSAISRRSRASGDYYPPDGIPAPTTVNIVGDARPEIVAPINDGYVYADLRPTASACGGTTTPNGAPKTFASEVVVADLNKDGVPELVFGTYSLQANGGHLVVLANTGAAALRRDAARPGDRRQRHRRPGGADDRGPRRRRAARDRRHDVRPRDRRVHRARQRRCMPPLAHRAREPAAKRDGPEHRRPVSVRAVRRSRPTGGRWCRRWRPASPTIRRSA